MRFLSILAGLQELALRTLQELANTTTACSNAMTALDNAKADKMKMTALNIPNTGWQTDGTVSYPYYIDIPISGVTENDCIGVVVSPDDYDAAKAACFTMTESKNGILRLRARNIPAKVLSASYCFIREDIVKAFGFEALNVDPYVLPMATRSSLGGIIVGDGLVINALGQLSVSISYEEFMLKAHPVGSAFFTIKDDDPAELFGGTWVKIAENRCIMGASGTHAAGTTVEAGLPNITGDLKENGTDVSPFRGSKAGLSELGALKFTEAATSWGGYSSLTASAYNIAFDASQSNAIYGASDTVQPAGYYMNIWVRTA
nr:MAG TPA: baseplate protein [Caudoviricetes sp.]